MQDYGRPHIAAALLLTALAGFVDATVFVSIGFFASFMSGNSTRLAAGWAAGATGHAVIAGALIASFVGGVMAASFLAAAAGRRRKPAVMALVTLLLITGAWLATRGGTAPLAAFTLIGAAMGAENGVFERDGEVAIGLTYMTGALVRMGQRLAAALAGRGPPFGWLPYFLLWAAFASGALAGAMAHGALGLNSLWIAAGAAAILALILVFVPPPPRTL